MEPCEKQDGKSRKERTVDGRYYLIVNKNKKQLRINNKSEIPRIIGRDMKSLGVLDATRDVDDETRGKGTQSCSF